MSLPARIGFVFIASAFCVLLAAGNTRVLAASAPVLISELQTGSSTSASEEFIELHNTIDQTVDLSSYKLEYYSSSATAFLPLGSPAQTIQLSGNIYPAGSVIIASSGYLANLASVSFSPTLADGGGTVRLVRTDANGQASTEDVLGWGTAKLFEGTVHAKPGSGKSLSRKTVDGLLVDTNNNAQDFDLLALPTPDNTNIAPPPIDPGPAPVETPPVDDPVDPAPVPIPDPEPAPDSVPALLPLSISELLPNPASPATDDQDEFVELYNPNDQEVSLAGYRIETGSNFTYHYIIGDGVIPAHGYVALFSKDTNLTLSNSAGAARLLDPSGAVINETVPYEDANDGEAWAYIDGAWKWTLTSTPNAANVLRLPLLPVVIISNPITKAKTTKAAAVAKPKAAVKTAAAKKTTAAKVKAASTTNNEDPPVGPASLHPSVLVGVGSLALLYAAYEYRGDIRSLVFRFQRYRDLRRNSG